MPFLTAKVAAPKSETLTQRIANAMLEITHRILKKDPKLTSIAIEFVEPQTWHVGGLSLAEQKQSSVYFEIRITDETNSKAEKALYIREVFQAFTEILGDLHPVSYILIHDVRAAAYGYGGETQEFRYHRN